MRTITVTALDDCVYQGKYFDVGTELRLPAVDAAALRYQGKVALASDSDKTAAARKRQPAINISITALDGAEVERVVRERVKPILDDIERNNSVDTPPKRRYRRRNLTAQD